MRPVIIVTALPSEAAPLIEMRRLKPVRGKPLFERFQVSASHEGTFVAVTGIGKLKSAAATAALYAALAADSNPLLVNIGIAGAASDLCALGEPFVVNKVRDAATNTRFYPDILVRHPFREAALDTHDLPLSVPPPTATLVDMEGAGFMQAATLVAAPSEIAVVKVVSDYCDGTKLTPRDATARIAVHTDAIFSFVDAMRSEIASPVTLSPSEREVLDEASNHAHLSHHQRLELARAALHRKARGEQFVDDIKALLQIQISSKSERAAAYHQIIAKLQESNIP
jgi:nucleoside phosphorylase